MFYKLQMIVSRLIAKYIFLHWGIFQFTFMVSDERRGS